MDFEPNFSQVKNEWKDIHLGLDNLKQLQAGINKLCSVVGGTMGARGRTVIIHNGATNTSKPTKDGVSVSNAVYLKDPVENIGANQIKQVAQNVVKAAGDGTTTATVFTASLVNVCIRLIEDGVQPYDIIKRLEDLHDIMLEHFKASVYDVSTNEDVRNIARIAANSDDEITTLIFKALSESGEDTVINIEHGNSIESKVSHTKGYSISTGFLNRNFKDPNRISVEYKNPLIFITKEELVGQYDIEHIMQISTDANRPLVIIAKDFLQGALNYITMNKLHGNLPILPIKAPRFGDEQTAILEDLAIYTNATLIAKEDGFALGMVDEDDFGTCDVIKAGTDYTHIFGGHYDGNKLRARVTGLKEQLQDTMDRDKHMHFIQSYKERISKLEDGICTIHVGGVTESEVKEKYDRVEDSLLATLSALEHGYVVGGGLFYRRIGAMVKVKSTDSIMQSLADACFSPSNQILDNAHLSDSPFVAQLDKLLYSRASKSIDWTSNIDFNLGIDVAKEETVNYIENGIIDAAKSTETIINNAFSFVKTFINTHATIVHRLDYFQNIQ